MSIGSALKWSFLSELASKAITPLVFVILARLLTPEDYGVVAAATMVISFSQIFWEAGMGKALIQYQGDRASAANAAFWVNNALGIVVAAALVLASPLVANGIFHDGRVTAVLQVMALQVFLAAIVSVHTALLQKDLQFRRLFWIRLVTVSLPGVIAIPMAANGLGYWALVAGALIGQAVQVAILWRMSHWRPAFAFDGRAAVRLSRFGIWVTASGLAAWFYLWADSLIVGMNLGAHELGLYRTGNAFVMMVYGVFFGPLLPVLYSHLSEIQQDRQRVKAVLSKVASIITFVSVPTAFLIYALAEPIGGVLFGGNWLGIGPVIAVMALTHGFSWTVGASGEAYRAIGRPDYETKIMVGALPLFLLAYWFGIQHGFLTFLWVRLSMTLVGLCLHLWLLHIAIDISPKDTVLNLAKVSAVGVPLILLGHTVRIGEATLIQQFAIAATATAWVMAYMWMIARNTLIPELFKILRRSLAGNRSAGST